ncbi:hypothetical protein M407DRAFT_244132 [Tulasnella calospora MUT 4182]|uniref:NAD(P)-binding protein n=1 Tax=Tulasnella calospora MUT 4182 TaxID=1051891 RepID=A0A0C3QHK7_9AGAM|nr:hypothetical protein M407DRAFT_244132 [Tulasnella calospora MUT 4182]
MFVGGTSGVGEGTVKAFAQAAQGRAHIVIVGRSRTRAEEIIASFPKTSESQYDFIQCDASLLKNVVTAANEAKDKISGPLNYLVLSPGLFHLKGFTPTSEGIDVKMALHFYSRWKFIDELIPLLDQAVASGQEARVMSIMDPKNAGLLDVGDFGVKKNYSLPRAAQQIGAYNSAMVQEYSPIHPTLSISHIYPGLVKTRIARDVPWYLKPAFSGLLLLGKTSEECGDWMFSALLNEKYQKGGFLLGEYGEELDVQRDSAENRALLLEHYRKQVAEATES